MVTTTEQSLYFIRNRAQIGLKLWKILESKGYHNSQANPCVFYGKYLVILTYVDNCVIVYHNKGTTTPFIGSLKNGPGG